MKKRIFSILLALCLLLGLALAPQAAAAETPEVPEAPKAMAEAAGAPMPAQSLQFGSTISAGTGYMTAIKEDGTLWAWGLNHYNQLGIGVDDDPSLTQLEAVLERVENPVRSPVQVPLEKRVVSVAASGHITAVITEDGELWNWGMHDANGILGREADGNDVPPGKVMSGVRSASVKSHGTALTEDGTLWLWGPNKHGQLGNGQKGGRLFVNEFMEYSYEPLPVRAMANVLAVETGSNNTFAILADHSLWAWGENDHGQLGNDCSVWTADEPHDDSLLGVTMTDSWTYEEDFATVTDDGTLWTAPAGFTHTSTYTFQSTPVKIMDGVAQVSADYYTMILKTDGSVWICEGKRELPPAEGERSSGRYTYAPRHVMDDAVQVSTYGGSFAAVKSDGSLWTWGLNYSGQLGQGDAGMGCDEPVKIMEDVVTVSVGEDFMAALKSDGSLWMWGTDLFGQLGQGKTYEKLRDAHSAVPVKVMDGVALPGKTVEAEVAADVQMPDSSSDSSFGAPASWMKIPQGAGYFNGNAYVLYNGAGFTWWQAEQYCEQQGGHLAVISTPEELEYVRGFGADFFLGSYVDNEGYYRWVTGENWYCKAWASGEPWSGNCIAMRGGQWYGWDGNYSPGYFLCEWEGGNTYTIYFDANGGTANAYSKQVYNGYTCGPLPIAVRSGYNFQGWYTDDGRLAVANSPVETNVDFTLHARWAVNTGGPTVNDVTYSFGNNGYDLGYQEGDKIPLDRYIYMFGNNSAARTAYEDAKPWNGSCLGMVTSATYLYMNNNPTPPSQLSLTDSNGEYTVKQLIESMHIIQRSNIFQRANGSNCNSYTSLANAVLNFQKTNTQPVFICFNGPRDREGTRPGHAVLGLGIYRDAANSRDVIQIYDPNFPGDTNRYIDLYWNAAGHYTGWYYCVNNEENWGSYYDNGNISYVTYSDMMAVWYARGSETALTANTMNLSCANASIYDYSGNLAATVRDGQVTSNRSDIFSFADPLDAGEAGAGGSGVTLWVPQEYFTVINEDPGAAELSVQVSGRSSTLSVTTSSDRVLVYANADDGTNVALVNGKDETYEMVFNSAEGGEVRLTGTTRENVPACFAQMSGELSGMGLGVGENSRLSINGQAGSAEDVAQTTVAEVVSSTAPSVISSVFADVQGDSYYAPAVQWAYGAGVTVGTALNVFTPDQACTRGEALALLWRALGCPTSTAAEMPFTDVQEGDYFYRAALWAAGTGVTLGTGDNAFSPEDICSDWEFLTFLWRALDTPGQRSELTGYDDAADWAQDLGLLRDTDAEEPCLRRDAVTFLYRALS